MFGFFKPKWQHRNPKIRIETIQEGNLDKELILKIAQTDKEPMVRIVAIRNINELNILYALFLQEPCIEGKDAVLQQISKIISHSDNPKAALHNFLNTTVRRDFPIADLLMASENSEFKALLFPAINAQKDLPRLLEAKYAFSFNELELIRDVEVLSALVKDANITDKKILAHLKELIKAQEESARKLALKADLLAKYELLASANPLPALNVFSDLEKEWDANDLGPENLVYKNQYLEKYQAHNRERQIQLTALQSIKDQLEEDYDAQAIVTSLRDLVDHNVFSIKEKQEIQMLIQQIENKQNESKKIIKENGSKKNVVADSEVKAEPKKQNDRVMFDRAKFEELSKKLQELLDEGSLQSAKKVNDEMLELVKQAENIKDKNHYSRILKQLSQPLYDQLDVARWGAHQALEKLCHDAEQLLKNASTDLLGDQLKQLRKNWEASKKSIVKAPYALHKRFEEACQKVHEKVTSERNSKSEARSGYMIEAQNLLDTLAQFIQQIDWGNPNWVQLVDTRSAFLQEWNKYLNQYSTDGVLSYGEPLFLNRDKHKLEKAMRQIMKPLDNAIQAERLKEKKRREDEIQELQKLLIENNLQEAIEKAKHFSKTFAPTVRLKHQEENQLWKQLRLVNDEIFSKREELYSTEEHERAENLKQKQTLLNELKDSYKALEADSEHKNETVALLRKIEEQWLDVGMISKNDYIRFENELAAVRKKITEKLSEIEQEKDNLQRIHLLSLSQKIGEIEDQALTGVDFEIEVSYYEQADAILRKRLKCLEQVKAGQESAKQFLTQKMDKSVEEARNIIILREIMLNVASPKEDQVFRLQKQAELLEHAMTNSFDDKDKYRQLKELDEQWLENVVGIIPEELYQRFR